MAFTLTIGSFDLAPYVRLGKEDGFDPYDQSGFEEPAFVDNPFGEGQALSNVDSRNREMVWPLYLNSSSKDALHTLIRDLNREIRYAAQPLRVAWRDQDASYTTYYDVEFARLDPSFSFRHSAQGWLAGTLRVWTKPFGHTGVWRTVATSGATSQVGTYVMDDLAGDMDAQVRVIVGASRVIATVGFPLTSIFSAMPYGWSPWLPAGSQTLNIAAGATCVGASGAIGSQIIRHTFGPGSAARLTLAITQLSATPYFHDAARALAPIRASAERPVTFNSGIMTFAGGEPLATSTVTPLASSGWVLADLGMYPQRTADSQGQASVAFIMTVQCASWGATSTLDVNGVFLLPESRTTLVHDSRHMDEAVISRVATDIIDGDTGAVHRQFLVGTEYPRRQIPPFGQVPQVAPHASEAIFVAQVAGGLVANNYQLNTSVAVRERFTVAR